MPARVRGLQVLVVFRRLDLAKGCQALANAGEGGFRPGGGARGSAVEQVAALGLCRKGQVRKALGSKASDPVQTLHYCMFQSPVLTILPTRFPLLN